MCLPHIKYNGIVYDLSLTPGVIHSLQDYQSIFAEAGTNPGEKTLEDRFYEREVAELHCAFWWSS